MYYCKRSLIRNTASKYYNNNIIQHCVLLNRKFSSTPSFFTKHEKVYALPFKLSEERAPQVIELANYITEHKFLGFFKLLKL
ncbi:unnamed protein product [Cunninghamella echinulata]